MQIVRQSPQHLLSEDQQAIVALCTPRGSGAIALIRISGVNAIQVADACAQLSSKTTLSQASSHTIHHGKIVDPDDNTVIDEVLFLLMQGPKTFTGHDTVEITCHNNPFIIEKIITLAVKHGARSARPGEFTKRAYLNGKIDLLQAESIHELINAQTELALRQSMAMVQGSLSNALAHIEKKLVELLGYVEASFEFLDEEQRDLNFNQAIQERTDTIIKEIAAIKAHFAQQQQIKEGIRIALLGSVNAGKSTLFNALVGKDRAIVTPIAGTTRDSIEASLYRNGNFWLLIDTAGMRQTDDVIERQGIQRSLKEASSADIMVLVIDASHPLSSEQQNEYKVLLEQYSEKALVVANKIDCTQNFIAQLHLCFNPHPMISVSAQEKIGINGLEEAIEQKISKLFAQLNSPYLLNQRQYNLLTEIEINLKFIANSYSNGIHSELVAYQLRDLLEKVSELTGKNISEKVMDKVFDEFCIGK